MLTFREYHSEPFSSSIQVSLAFVISSASCATIALITATQLSLRFDESEPLPSASGNDEAETSAIIDLIIVQDPICGKHLLLVNIPILLLDWSVFAFLVGILLWYGALPGRSTVGFEKTYRRFRPDGGERDRSAGERDRAALHGCRAAARAPSAPRAGRPNPCRDSSRHAARRSARHSS